jgi:hypothetical protein
LSTTIECNTSSNLASGYTSSDPRLDTFNQTIWVTIARSVVERSVRTASGVPAKVDKSEFLAIICQIEIPGRTNHLRSINICDMKKGIEKTAW